jgi:hypothetical protein
MKAQFYHANRFGFEVVSQSDRLGGSAPETTDTRELFLDECLVVLFHVEEGDGDRQVHRLCKDIKRMGDELGVSRLMVAAFGHLSSSFAPVDVSVQISKEVLKICTEWGKEIHTSPFGYNKTFVLETKGHQKAIRFRSY